MTFSPGGISAGEVALTFADLVSKHGEEQRRAIFELVLANAGSARDFARSAEQHRRAPVARGVQDVMGDPIVPRLTHPRLLI
jgi:hypothetical protein